MDTGRLLLTFVVLAATGMCAEPKKEPDKKKAPDPKISSIYPVSGQRGSTFETIIRGSNLADARAVIFEGSGAEARVISVTSEPKAAGETTAKDSLKAEVLLAPDSAVGDHEFRVITPFGVSNKLPLRVSAERVLDAGGAAEPLKQFPVMINGRIPQPGSTGSYWIEVADGDTLTFDASSVSGVFDPSVILYQPTGSWFDPNRLNQVASNDEPLSFPGLSTDAHLVQHFAHGGKYRVSIKGFEGQGGPDCVYQLRIAPGVIPTPPLHPKVHESWEERQFTRAVAARVQELASRTGIDADNGSVEVYRAVPQGSKEIPVMSVPGIVEGRLDRPGEAHVIHLKVDKPQDLAIEVETPEATLPRFNPVVRLIDPEGREIATDVYTKLNNNGLYMMKMIGAKTTFSLTATGEYTIQIHEITTNGAAPDFLYRVLVRPQVPHVGKFAVTEDHINLPAGSSHPITVTIDREEGFKDYVTVAVEGLPEGVTALPAVEDHVEPPPLPNGGRVERYVAKPQRASVMLVAADDAHLTDMPVRIKLVARVLRDEHILKPIAIKEMLIMVVAPRKS